MKVWFVKENTFANNRIIVCASKEDAEEKFFEIVEEIVTVSHYIHNFKLDKQTKEDLLIDAEFNVEDDYVEIDSVEVANDVIKALAKGLWIYD